MAYPSFGDSSGLFPILLGETEAAATYAATNTLGLTDTATHNYVIETVAQTIGLTDEATLPVITRLASDRLFYFGALGPSGQAADHNYVYADAENSLGFDDISGYDQELNIKQWIGFTPRYFAPDLLNFLGLSSEVHIAVIENVGNTFSWIDHEDPEAIERALKQSYNAVNQLALASVVGGGAFQDVYDVLGLEDVADSSDTEYERDAGGLNLKDRVTFKITGSRCVEKEYSPYIGEGDDGFPSMAATAPTLGRGVLTLSYPRVGPTSTLVLKNPIFGNEDSLAFPKIDRTTRGGERKIFSDTSWGGAQVLTFRIENVCSPEIDEVIAFLNTSLGKEIGLLDWENRNWAGVIVVPQTEISLEIGGYRVQFTFEGELV